MVDYDAFESDFLEALSPEEKALETGFLGYTVAGAFTVPDPDTPGNYLVRSSDGGGVESLPNRYNLAPYPNLPVYIGEDDDGVRVIQSLNEDLSLEMPGGNKAAYNLPQHTHARFSGFEFLIDARLFQNLRLNDRGGGVFYISAGYFRYDGKLRYWNGNLTKNIVGTHSPSSGKHRWVIFGIDMKMASPIIYATGLTEKSTALPLSKSDLDSWVIPFGVIPIAALKFVNGQTTWVEADFESFLGNGIQTQNGSGGSGDGLFPYRLLTGETYIVPENKQQMAFTAYIEGSLIIDGVVRMET